MKEIEILKFLAWTKDIGEWFKSFYVYTKKDNGAYVTYLSQQREIEDFLDLIYYVKCDGEPWEVNDFR